MTRKCLYCSLEISHVLSIHVSFEKAHSHECAHEKSRRINLYIRWRTLWHTVYNHNSMASLPTEDAELQLLVCSAQDGDTEAFGKIYDLFFTSIYRYTAFRLPAEAAEDVCADIFVKAWEKISTYKVQKGVPFGAWLFRIARHTVIDAYRQQRGFEEIPETLADPDSWNQADHRVKQGDLVRVVRGALDQLPQRYREILLLSYVAELKHKAVAKVLRMTEGGVRIRKLRALRRLKELLPPELHG